MADYWKSNPRRMCDVCKVWMADNKVSISMHEGGKKHKENVQRRISEARKRGVEEIHEQDEIQRQLAVMEKAAFEAYKKDVQNDPMLAGTVPAGRQHYGVARGRSDGGTGPGRGVAADHEGGVASDEAESGATEDSGDPAVNAMWTAYSTEEGYVYYYNSSSGQTTWEKPLGYSSTAAPMVVPDSSATERTSNTAATSSVSGLKAESQKSVPASQSNSSAIDVPSNSSAAASSVSVKEEDSFKSVPVSHSKRSAADIAYNSSAASSVSVKEEDSSKSVPVSHSKRSAADVASNSSATSSVSVEQEDPSKSASVPASQYGKWTVTLVKSEEPSRAHSAIDSVKRENPDAGNQDDDDDDGVGAGLTCRDDQDDDNRFKFQEKTLPSLVATESSDGTESSSFGMFKKRKRAGGRRGRADDD